MRGNAPVNSSIPAGDQHVDPATGQQPDVTSRPRRRRLRRLVARVVLGLVALVVTLALASGGIFVYARVRLNQAKVTCGACRVDTASSALAGPMNILVLGSDARPGQAELGQRADTIAILHVDFSSTPSAGKAVLINIPRDLRVKAPDGQFVKINSFYNTGPSAMVQAVTAFTGLSIDHYVEVNFAGFASLVDTLGGVRMRFSQAITDPNSGLDVPAGCVTLHGDQALAFVRLRSIDSDYGRIARQQLFVQLVMRQLLSAGTLLNPVKVVDLADLAAANVKTDTGLGTALMERLALQLRDFEPGNLDFRVVPAFNQTIGGVAFLTPYAGESASLFDAIRNGDPLPDYGTQGTTTPPPGVEVVLLNGSGQADAGAQAAVDLQGAGYDVLTTGSAGGTTYPSSGVFFTPGNQDRATALAQAFGEAAPQPLPAALAAQVPAGGAGAGVVLLLGQDYQAGMAGLAAASSGDLPAGPAAALPGSSLGVTAC